MLSMASNTVTFDTVSGARSRIHLFMIACSFDIGHYSLTHRERTISGSCQQKHVGHKLVKIWSQFEPISVSSRST